LTSLVPTRSGGKIGSGGLLVARRARQLAELAFDALLPQICVGCSVTLELGGAPLCGPCETRLREIPAPRCPRCGFTRFSDLSGPGSCAECDGWPEVLQRSESAFLLSESATRLVHGLKYQGWTTLAPRMGALMAPSARRVHPGPGPGLLVPVPLSRSRLRERGYNQALLLAEGLGQALDWPVRQVLARVRNGGRQAGSGRWERAVNVAGAFRLNSGMSYPAGTPVLLVDDVITTGSTLAECCQALLDAGVSCAGGVSFARTPPSCPGA
jgi:ComF family protein